MYNGASWASLGLSWDSLGALLGSLRLSWDSLGLSFGLSGPLGPLLGQLTAKKDPKPVFAGCPTRNPCFYLSWGSLGDSWASLQSPFSKDVPREIPVFASLGALLGSLGVSWGSLGALLGLLGLSWALLGLSWAHLGAHF